VFFFLIYIDLDMCFGHLPIAIVNYHYFFLDVNVMASFNNEVVKVGRFHLIKLVES